MTDGGTMGRLRSSALRCGSSLTSTRQPRMTWSVRVDLGATVARFFFSALGAVDRFPMRIVTEH